MQERPAREELVYSAYS